MADRPVRVEKGALRRITVPTPNPAFAEWLMGPESRAEVERVTTEIYTAYTRTLPVRTGNLVRGAYMDIRVGGFGNEHDRWVGYVGNNALSYRPRKGYLYGRFIEYGKPTRGIPGQAQLRRAAELVTGDFTGAAGFNLPPGFKRDRRGRLRDSRGRFARDPRRR